MSPLAEKALQLTAIDRLAANTELRRNAMSNAMLLELRKKKTSHLLHLVLTLITAGLWLFIWIIVALSNSIENGKIDKQINQILASERNA